MATAKNLKKKRECERKRRERIRTDSQLIAEENLKRRERYARLKKIKKGNLNRNELYNKQLDLNGEKQSRSIEQSKNS